VGHADTQTACCCLAKIRGQPVYVGHLCGSTYTRPAYTNLWLNFPIFVAILIALFCHYVWVLISLWLFLFAAQPKEFFLDGLKKLEQGSHKFVWSSGGNM
jgi:hypothetical protein